MNEVTSEPSLSKPTVVNVPVPEAVKLLKLIFSHLTTQQAEEIATVILQELAAGACTVFSAIKVGPKGLIDCSVSTAISQEPTTGSVLTSEKSSAL